MNRLVRLVAPALVLMLMFSAGLGAQEAHVGQQAFRSAQGEHVQSSTEIDIMGHLANAGSVTYPCLSARLECEWRLPTWKPIRLGGLEIDFSPTKHSVYLIFAAVIVGLVFVLSARSIARAHAKGRPPRGFAGAMEATALYVRQEVILPNVGHHGERYVPYLLTLFFFILVCNLLGAVPWGATATGNIAVTGALALLAFVVVEVSGMRALGFKGYLGTIFYLPHGLPLVLRPIILVIMTPIEIIGKLAKPFALAVRLFANMTAGHALILALIGLTFTFHSYLVGGAASVMATGMMLLELFVALLQAYVFTLLTAVFIGLIREAH